MAEAKLPKTLEEAFQLAESLAAGACEAAFKATGERPHTERRAASIVVVWRTARLQTKSR